MNAFEKIGKYVKNFARASMFSLALSVPVLSPIMGYASQIYGIKNAGKQTELSEAEKAKMLNEIDELSKKYTDDYFIKPDKHPLSSPAFFMNFKEEKAEGEYIEELSKLKNYQEKLGMPDSTINKTKRLLVYAHQDLLLYKKKIIVDERKRSFAQVHGLSKEIMKSDSAFGKSDDLIYWMSGAMPLTEAYWADPNISKIAELAGKDAPEINVNSIDDWFNSWTPIKLRDLKGKVIMLDVWATGCGPCVKMLPETEEVWQKYRDKGLVVIGVNVYKEHSEHERIKEKIIENGLTYPIVIDDGSMEENYGITGVPQVFLIDKKGKVRPRTSIEELLNEK